MYISFFKNNNEAIIGTDYSWHNDILHQEDLDFNPETQIAELIENNWKFSINISKKPEEPKVETEGEKFTRIYNFLLNQEIEFFKNIENKNTLEGVIFSNKQIGDFIVDYVFGGNPHEQMSIFAKTLAGNKDPQFLEWVNSKTNKTNDVLTFFNMAGL